MKKRWSGNDPCATLVRPLYDPCTTLVQPLYDPCATLCATLEMIENLGVIYIMLVKERYLDMLKRLHCL